jgi:hypothetical protein
MWNKVCETETFDFVLEDGVKGQYTLISGEALVLRIADGQQGSCSNPPHLWRPGGDGRIGQVLGDHMMINC